MLTRVEALGGLLCRIYADLGICRALWILVVSGRERHSVDAFHKILSQRSASHNNKPKRVAQRPPLKLAMLLVFGR